MYIWILDSNGLTLLYYNMRELEIDEHLVSGLISALNQFTLMQFQQPIESIEMGGFRWVYILDETCNILFVVADSKDISNDMLNVRLDVIRHRFLKEYVTEKGLCDGEWHGDLSIFEPFKEIIAKYYNQWTQTEILESGAEFFDMMGIFQQYFNILRNIIEKNIFSEKKERIYTQIQSLYEMFVGQHDYDEYKELNKIEYERKTGFNLLNINPMNCDILTFKKFVLTLLAGILGIIKVEIGHDQLLLLFSEEGLINYTYSNLVLFKKLNLDVLIFELFLLK